MSGLYLLPGALVSPSFGGFSGVRGGALPWAGSKGSCKLRYAPRALNSAVECHLHTVEVAGSNPAAPTINH